MDGLIINNTNLGFKTINGKRVVTFKEIDEVHGGPDGTAYQRFNDNRKHFVLKEDYWLLTPKDLENAQTYEKHRSENDAEILSISGIEEVNNKGTIFLTETGYLMIVKSFNDDLAWDVQRRLVDTYFKAQELALTIKDMLALKEELTEIIKSQTLALEEKHTSLSGEVTNLKAAVEDIREGKVKQSIFVSQKKIDLGNKIESIRRNIVREGRKLTKEEMTQRIIEHMVQYEGIDFDRYADEYRRRYRKDPYLLDVIMADGDLISAFESALDAMDAKFTNPWGRRRRLEPDDEIVNLGTGESYDI